MSSASSITFTDIKIIDAVCVVVGVLFTAVRLVLRVQSGRIWWDDALALLSALCSILTSAASGMHYRNPDAYTLVTRLAAYYLIAEGFYLTLWTARLSILFSIIRIVPEEAQKRFLYRTAIAFTTVLVFFLAQVFWVCEAPDRKKWKTAPNPQCSLGLQVAVCQLIADILSDILLIVVPVRLLSRTNLDRALKTRLIIIFSATLLTTVVGLVHAAYLLKVRGIDAIVSALVELGVGLVVCNLVVVVPALWRVLGGGGALGKLRERGRVKEEEEGEPSFKISTFRLRRERPSGLGVSVTTGAGVGMSVVTGVGTVEGFTGFTSGLGMSQTTSELEGDADAMHVHAQKHPGAALGWAGGEKLEVMHEGNDGV